MRLAALLASLSLVATAADAAMTATQVVEKEIVVVDKNGEEKIVRKKADRVKPGETVIYSLKFKNDAATAADGVILVMPVPKDVTFVEGSVDGAAATVAFSADGGDTYVERGRLTVTQNGEERPATNNDITHIQWKLAGPVAPKGTGEISFRGVLK